MRPITGPEEIDLFARLPYLLNEELADDFAAGRRRPEWTWVALRGDRLVARLAWWSPPNADAPFLLDFLDVDDAEPDAEEVGVHLLRTAQAAVVTEGTAPPEYTRFVPADWQGDEAAGDTVRTRMAVVERLGAEPLVERLRLEWRPETPLPGAHGRLVFRRHRDTEELLALMAEVLEGTLDMHSVEELTRMSPRESAELMLEEEFANFRSPSEWWRVATLPDGEPVGFVIPARNQYNPILAYIGVLPRHRGRGYVDDLLAEGTRVLASQDVLRVRAATDVGNVPMADAFRRAGYQVIGGVVTMVWSRG